jgi:hypothetical protein
VLGVQAHALHEVLYLALHAAARLDVLDVERRTDDGARSCGRGFSDE